MSDPVLHPTGIVLGPDSRRVLVRPFIPKDPARVESIVGRGLSLSDADVAAQLEGLRQDFGSRHIDLEGVWARHADLVADHLEGRAVSPAHRLYIGALFTGEYAVESAALFNPSIVPHPDQLGLPEGAMRFILSLRATGEGHISSIGFRSGVVDAEGNVSVDPPTNHLVTAPMVKANPTYRKSIFSHSLREMGFGNAWSDRVLGELDADFTRDDLELAMGRAAEDGGRGSRDFERTEECTRWLARSNYEAHFPTETTLSQRKIFPVSPNESNGIEDARFVRFVEDDGQVSYYATYTAYNGRATLPQWIETPDFLHFRVRTLNGRAAQNKGMALFPRRVGGLFAMLARHDDENLFLMYSDNLHFWDEPRPLATPTRAWEFVKIGNCGSPIETEDGWLVITHGVGAMRCYSMGAMLLDRDDPERVIGWLDTPLVTPAGAMREGYVPNVVYSCGSLVHRGRLILPYACSDTCSTIATFDLAELLAALKRRGTPG